MANIADTHYRIYGSSETLEKLIGIIEVGDTLRGVAEKLGADESGLYMRGYVQYMEYDERNKCLDIDADTAWSEQSDFIDLLNTLFKNDNEFMLEWRCQELGCEYFCSNVEGAIYGEYISDYSGDGIEYYDDFESLKKYVIKELARANDFTDGDGHEEAFQEFDTMKEWLRNHFDDESLNFFNIYKAEIV